MKSNILVSNTGSPRCCALSPLLCILYTERSTKEESYLVKFSDDTALLSLLQDSESDHGSALTDFVYWCDDNFLELNVVKTKEVITDFMKNNTEPKASIIHSKDVEIEDNDKYPGTVFDSQLKFDVNTDTIVNKESPYCES